MYAFGEIQPQHIQLTRIKALQWTWLTCILSPLGLLFTVIFIDACNSMTQSKYFNISAVLFAIDELTRAYASLHKYSALIHLIMGGLCY